jgi:hypothetical protein
MGTVDEHWCTLCKKKLDKSKDKYIDFELIHQGAKPVVKKWKKPKGLICMECIEKDPKLKAMVDAILAAGNPPFVVEIVCHFAHVCPTFEPSSKPGVNCKHIAVIRDLVYCKRSHPGGVRLMMERSEKMRFEQQIFIRFVRRMAKRMPVEMRTGMETAMTSWLPQVWTSPSAVVPGVSGVAPKEVPQEEKAV